MKVALILPPCTEKEIFGKLTGSHPVLPPLDLASIASSLKVQGHDVIIYDCFAEHISREQLKILLEENDPQVVGITVDLPSLSSPLLPQAYDLARLCKNMNPRVKTIFYGYSPTRFPDRILSKDQVDFVILGEGEVTTGELLKTIERRDDLRRVDGLGFKLDGKIIINQRREQISNLDILPLPAYQLLPIEKYKVCSTSIKKQRQMTIMSSRGCPFNCYLCTSPLFWRQKWRGHSPEYLIKNMDYLYKKYGIEDFQFRDDIFTFDRNRVKEFCTLLIEEKRTYVWNCYATFNTIDKDLVRLMKKAGCYQLDLGVETGTEQILKEYKKVPKDQIKEMMIIMKDAGMESRLFFIIGPPSRTIQDVEKTIEFAIELDPDYVIFSPSAPYPGSQFYDQLIEKGYQLPDFEQKLFVENKAICNLPDFDREYIDAMVKKAFRKFYLRPQYVLKKMLSIRSGHQLKCFFHSFISLVSFIGGSKK
ncbi:MAG: cobalamin-dependent protein [Candidatus Omnitrophica bacterium]|nr:cobalamin-dependent protein [Candidatus Omnitrophota bacterium]